MEGDSLQYKMACVDNVYVCDTHLFYYFLQMSENAVLSLREVEKFKFCYKPYTLNHLSFICKHLVWVQLAEKGNNIRNMRAEPTPYFIHTHTELLFRVVKFQQEILDIT